MYFLLQSYSQGVIANHRVANYSECRTVYILFYPPFCCLKKIDFCGHLTRGYNQHRVGLFSPLYGLMGETEEVKLKYCGSNTSIKK